MTLCRGSAKPAFPRQPSANSAIDSMYRIRALTEAEKETKVSQQVARQREWEEGLVSSYKRFLELCEAEATGAFRARESTCEFTIMTLCIVR